MNEIRTIKRALLAAAAASLCAGAPLSASARLPSYAIPGGERTIRGTVASIDGKYDITVRDDRGYLDNVSLHQGTIINPTGLTLEPGQRVTILGIPEGSTFAANEIDTPYTYVAVPYPYPAYGIGFGFDGFGFGGDFDDR